MSKSTLKSISPDLYLGEPAPKAAGLPASTTAASKDPELVVLFGWMDAQLKHLEKYTDAYRLLFPAATLLLVRSRQSHFYRLRSSQLASLQPLASLIRTRAPAALPGPTSPVLVHTFSNGGCFGLKTLNELFEHGGKGETQRLLGEGRGLPARAVVFDSCPGDTDLRITVRAFTAPLRSLWIKVPASALVAIFYAFAKLANFIRRKPSTLHLMGTYLNSNLPPAPRLYLYSSEDLLIPAPHVEAHAATAKSIGVDVRLEKFQGTQHVSHVRGPGNEQRYWAAVRSLWERSGVTKAE